MPIRCLHICRQRLCQGTCTPVQIWKSAFLQLSWGLKFLTKRMKVEHYFRNEFLLVRTGASLKVRTVQCSTTKPCPTTVAVVYSREPPYTSTNPSLDAHAGKPFPTSCRTAAADISISVYHRNHRWRPLHVSTSRVQSRISIG